MCCLFTYFAFSTIQISAQEYVRKLDKNVVSGVCRSCHICPKTTTECPMVLISLPRVTQVTRVTILYQLMKWIFFQPLREIDT